MAHHAMLQVITIWATANLSAIAFLCALFLVEAGRPRRRRGGGARVTPISGR